VALAVIGTELVRLNVQLLSGLGWGAAGRLSYSLAEFLADYRDGLPEGRHRGLYLAQVVVRVILGAVVGAATLALGQSAAFVSGLAAPAALVALGAKFGRRKPRPGGKESASDAGARPNARDRTGTGP
jgi:hypothetical protein